MKVAKITIEKTLKLLNLIKGVGVIDEKTKQPKFKLPVRFAWACSRTQKKIGEAIEPLQPRFDEIWKEWNEKLKPEFEQKLEKAKGKKKAEIEAEKQAVIKANNEKWDALAKEEIEVEIFEFPKFRENEIAQLDQCSFTPNDLELFIDFMNLSLGDEAA